MTITVVDLETKYAAWFIVMRNTNFAKRNSGVVFDRTR